MDTNPVDDLARALDAAGRLVAGVRQDQWNDPTPCTEWDVRALVTHLVGGNRLFETVLRGEAPSRDLPPQAHGDLATAYRDGAARLLDAFRRPGVLHEMVTVPFGTVPGIVALHLRTTEVLVHGWDIARATGQPATFPEDVAARELEFSRARLGDVPADRSPFGPPVPIPDGAPAIDRLAACLGRSAGPAGTRAAD